MKKMNLFFIFLLFPAALYAQTARYLSVNPTVLPVEFKISSVFKSVQTVLWQGSTNRTKQKLFFYVPPGAALFVETKDASCRRYLQKSVLDFNKASKQYLCSAQNLKSSDNADVIVRGETSTTLFVDNFDIGPSLKPVRVNSYDDFEKSFGSALSSRTTNLQLMKFFENGGQAAVIMRTRGDDTKTASVKLKDAKTQQDILNISAIGAGAWGNTIHLIVGEAVGHPDLFSLIIESYSERRKGKEEYPVVSLDPEAPTYIVRQIYEKSRLIHVADLRGWGVKEGALEIQKQMLVGGTDGAPVTSANVVQALNLLNNNQDFQLISLGTWSQFEEIQDRDDILSAAADLAIQSNSFVILDSPKQLSQTFLSQGVEPVADWTKKEFSILDESDKKYFAFYFPQADITEPLSGKPINFPMSSIVAGIYGRADSQVGVWSAPSGFALAPVNISDFDIQLYDKDIGILRAANINPGRTFPNYGPLIWGTSTLDTNDFKYVIFTRLFQSIHRDIQRDLYRFTYEPNDQILWDKVRVRVQAYLDNLYKLGAFPGQPRVVCDASNNTNPTVASGVLNVQIMYPMDKPEDYVVDSFQINVGLAQ